MVATFDICHKLLWLTGLSHAVVPRTGRTKLRGDNDMAVKVDEAKCTGCGDCTETCPSEALKVENGKVKVDEGECSDCAACVDVCPEGSLALD